MIVRKDDSEKVDLPDPAPGRGCPDGAGMMPHTTSSVLPALPKFGVPRALRVDYALSLPDVSTKEAVMSRRTA